MDMFPPLLISKSVDDAKNKINLKIAQNKLPAGLQKRLLHYLLSRSTTECICGRPLGEDERKHLEGFLDIACLQNPTPTSIMSLFKLQNCGEKGTIKELSTQKF